MSPQSSDFCFAPKLDHGLDNFKIFFSEFSDYGIPHPHVDKDFCDGTGVRDPEVVKIKKKNFGAIQAKGQLW